MEIILIAAMASNRVIGRNNTIPWHIPGEQKRFRDITWGYPLIMGRKTHESIGRPLPGRRNIIVTRNQDYCAAAGCEVVNSLDQAYSLCRNEQRLFNIGGEQLYRHGLAHATTLLLSMLDYPLSGDAFFPDFSEKDFQLVSHENITGQVPYSFLTYCRVTQKARR